MTPPKPVIVRLHEMTSGQHGDFFVLMEERSRGLTRDGKPFYTCRFRDAERTVTFMVWSDSHWFQEAEAEWRENQFYKIRGFYNEHKTYGPQIDVQNIRPVNEDDVADGFNPRDFVEASRFDPSEMFADLRQIAEEQITNEGLQNLVMTILDRHADAIKTMPATDRRHYPFHGGLLEHTLSVTRNCLVLVDRYTKLYPELQPPLNADLVVAAAILHDIGRVQEFDDNVVTFDRTVPGRMLGHLYLGRDLIRDTARELGDIDPGLLQLLEHLIITHLSFNESNFSRLATIPESLILHHADELDAKMEMYVRCLTRDHEDGPFTARDPMFGRRLLKDREV
ncbi:MAG: 3'-5' exoribonuclease YhaM family protein [Gemmataceae bacterium]